MCPKGWHTTADQSSTCQQCIEGRYRPGESLSTTDLTEVDGVTRKVGLKRDTYPSTAKHDAAILEHDEREDCKSCPIGMFRNIKAAPSCTKCSGGQYQENGGTGERMVESTSENNPTICKICGKGRFILDGLVVSHYGKIDSCKECIKGQYNDLTGIGLNNQCKLCKKGKYQHQTGQDACIVCDPGRYIKTAVHTERRRKVLAKVAGHQIFGGVTPGGSEIPLHPLQNHPTACGGTTCNSVIGYESGPQKHAINCEDKMNTELNEALDDPDCYLKDMLAGTGKWVHASHSAPDGMTSATIKSQNRDDRGRDSLDSCLFCQAGMYYNYACHAADNCDIWEVDDCIVCPKGKIQTSWEFTGSACVDCEVGKANRYGSNTQLTVQEVDVEGNHGTVARKIYDRLNSAQIYSDVFSTARVDMRIDHNPEGAKDLPKSTTNKEIRETITLNSMTRHEHDHAIDCKSCPEGYWALVGFPNCIGCPGGWYQDQLGRPLTVNGDKCKECVAGKYATGSADSCKFVQRVHLTM